MADLSTYDPVFEEAGREWNVDPRLLKAMSGQESDGNPRAVSKAGAQGLMQIMPATQRYLGVTDPNDPVQSIWAGAKYMAEALDAEKSPEAALLYYHGGKDWRNAYGPESAGYVPGVTKQYQALAKAAPTPQGAPTAVPAAAPRTVDDDPFAASLASARKGASGVPAGEQNDPFAASLEAARKGAGSPAAGSQATPPNPTTVTPNDISGEGRDEYGNPLGPLGPPGPAASFPTVAGMREALAPTPGWVSSGILPMATKEVSPGQGDPAAGVKLDWGPIRTIGNPLLDLLEGTGQATSAGGPNAPLAGKVSPEASALLASSMLGNPNPLAKFGAFRGGENPLVAGGPFAAGTPLTPVEAAAALAKSDARAAPLPADFRAAPTAPGFDGPKPAPVQIDIGGGQTILVPAANPLTPAADVNPNLPANLLQNGGRPIVGPAQPNAAGAQASTAAQARMTPEAAAIAQSQAEHNRYNERQSPGVPDTAIKVPGVEPTKAQMEQTVNAAREIKGLININAEVGDEAAAVADQHNAARHLFVGDIAGSIPDLANAVKTRGDKMTAALAAVWAKKKPADVGPVVDLGNKFLDGSEGKRDLVVKEVNSVLAKLENRAGDVETDPELLYGVRKHINDRLSKEAAVDDPQVVRAQAVLLALRDELDKAIEPAAPGFGKAIKDFAEASRPIDVMEAMQKAEPGLSDTQGRMQYSRVHKLMREIITARRPDAALSKWQSLTTEDMDKLWGLHDDLRRVASAEELARAKGSDTAMNGIDIAKEYAKMAGATVVGLANAVPILGPVVRNFREGAAPILGARAARGQVRRGNALLYPDRSGIQPPLP